MRAKILFASGLLVFASAYDIRADTPLDILGVEKSLKDAKNNAVAAGDEIAQRFAEQALKVISAWKEANGSLIKDGKAAVDDTLAQVFQEFENTATRIEKGEAVTFVDLQSATASLARALEKIPFSSREPQFTFYRPSVALPVGTDTLVVQVIGSGIAKANPKVIGPNGSVEFQKPSDNSITFLVARAEVAKQADTKALKYKVTYDIDRSRWNNPVSWFRSESAERDVVIAVLPTIPGTVNIDPIVKEVTWETDTYGPEYFKERGKDKPFPKRVNIKKELQEAGWILDKDAQKTAKWDDNGGDGNGGSSCTGPDRETFDDKGFVFYIQHGSRGNSDAYQGCRTWVAIKRPVVSKSNAPRISKDLDWLKDTDLDLPPATDSYKMLMTTYDKREVSIANKNQVPYGLFDVMIEGNAIKFRPRPMRDF
ncbi:hypothetical protein NKJ72_19960 [Mesorhizobium sp. M0045]|uniref:hypothetical protein n=1 Tax=Mesorhizobium sp. M0045 TaxID=2956857 RepID=UPI003337AE8B